ncbi:MAG: hypothetical protein FJZ01_13710 [Candidatus Sericytochromatia bacterium]|nr:hypothetical protein [Candidatus Tanganyikabacteria bacterium]
MDIDLRTALPPQITARKSAMMLDLNGGTVSLAVELFNHGDSPIESVTASLAIQDECCDVKAMAETATGPVEPLEVRLVNFTLPVIVADFVKLDFRVEVGRLPRRP